MGGRRGGRWQIGKGGGAIGPSPPARIGLLHTFRELRCGPPPIPFPVRLSSWSLALWLLAAATPLQLSADPPHEDLPSIGYFEGEVRSLRDRLGSVPTVEGAVAFIGSSSIRLWKTLERDFPGRTVVNCGFGGSSIRDWIYYGPQLFERMKPSAIVMYCGENDLARGEDPDTVFVDLQRFYHMLRTAFPGVPLAYVAVKPSPARAHLQGRMIRFNALAANFLGTRKNGKFVDLYSALLGPGGEAEPAYFQQDRLHLSAAGYAVFQKAVDRFLRENIPLPDTGS